MESKELTHQQRRFCDEYLVNFNAYRAALSAGYSENTARKAELLHLPRIQAYLKAAMNQTTERLEITHDMILRELAKIAFANMGNYYDERGVLKPMSELSADEKAAINQYQILDAVNDDGQRIGELSKIKLHNKLSALDKIARHLNFYGIASQKQEAGGKNQEEEVEGCGLPVVDLEEKILDDKLDATVKSDINEAGPLLEGPALVLAKILTLSPFEESVDIGESGAGSLLLHSLRM